jgi:hypothetical protein
MPVSASAASAAKIACDIDLPNDEVAASWETAANGC